ncbi:MurR/RpiR family transcriptional regulator [Chthonobacter rhizosphaerae]|uniref:MurR/RpiR family transcriptional regulator n=1 Tax=Chthonobacter rhizosphaerae TaxID=2735553 RepID=UPI0015EFD9EF|nr:MurR/RpiR family transcriptional regulator [Chthonobacter rhizosphaerae]
MNSKVKDMLTAPGLALTPSEARIVQVLLSDYPMSGLGTATTLARRAGVSDPTVGRLVIKLGFDGYPAFQARLLAEVEARLHSPLLMMEAKRPAGDGDGAAQAYLASVGHSLDATRQAVPEQAYGQAVRLLLETKGQVYLVGGRFSRGIAAMLAGYLQQFRPGVVDLGILSADRFDALVDIGRRDLLVVFDYRRYQSDVVAFARQAADRGARILLFTDVWLSPVAEFAEVTLSARIEVDSPYDTLAPAVAQMEAVIAHAVAETDFAARDRIERIEQIRAAQKVTLDDEPGRNAPPRRGPDGVSRRPKLTPNPEGTS